MCYGVGGLPREVHVCVEGFLVASSVDDAEFFEVRAFKEDDIQDDDLFGGGCRFNADVLL